MPVTPGDQVLYTFTDADVLAVQRLARSMRQSVPTVAVGATYPAIVVSALGSSETPVVDLQVYIPAPTTHYVQGVVSGNGQGQYQLKS